MSSHPNLSNGVGYLAIPGPSVIPEEVLRAMHRPAPNIYAGELVDMMPPLMNDLRKMARTEHHVAMYIGDDVTDEDAFAALEGKGYGILVADPPRSSKAAYHIKDTREVKKVLDFLINIERQQQ